jgi:hypothetical protein
MASKLANELMDAAKKLAMRSGSGKKLTGWLTQKKPLLTIVLKRIIPGRLAILDGFP